jgi:hypothetical protein
MPSQPTIQRGDRLRRVLILCQAVARNLAYYRVGWREEYKDISDYSKHPQSANFWRVANSNFIDMCVLEWCKLFADRNGKHSWGNVVADPAGFKTALLAHLGLDLAAFEREIEVMVRYRDKFLAHLDSEVVMNIPGLEIAKKAAWFYYSYLVANESTELAGFDSELNVLYTAFEREAEAAYRRVR